METIYSFGKLCQQKAHERRQYETEKSYRTLLRHLENFSGNGRLCFCNLTPGFLLEFCRYLTDKGCCNNTRLLYFRNLQVLHRRAAKEGVATNPDDLYSIVLTDANQTVKRSISALLLQKIRDAVLPQAYSHLAFARDMFILSFYLRGIPFVDLAHLRKTDIKGNILRYHRRKTGKPLVITIEPCAAQIVNRWRNHTGNSPYLFPIIKCCGSDEDEQRQYESGLRLYNKHLKVLPLAIGLYEDIRLTSYTPRHTWANLAHDDGVEVPFISEALSHSSEKITRYYMTSFTADTLAAVNRRVIGIIDRQCFRGRKNEGKR